MNRSLPTQLLCMLGLSALLLVVILPEPTCLAQATAVEEKDSSTDKSSTDENAAETKEAASADDSAAETTDAAAPATSSEPKPMTELDAAARERIATDLKYISSDELEGRNSGSEGIRKAGEYIATRFKDLGLNLELFEGEPFQQFEIPGRPTIGDAEANKMVLEIGDEKITWELGKDYTPVTLGSNGSFSAPIAFAGYGITTASDDSDIQYDDYGDIEAEGKVVIVLRKEPRQTDADSPFNGTDPSQYSFFATKGLNAAQHKVAAMIMVNDSQTETAGTWPTESIEAIRTPLKVLATLDDQLSSDGELAADDQADWLTRYESATKALDQAVRSAKTDSETLPGINGAGRAYSAEKVPTVFATRAIVNQLLAKTGNPSLDELEKSIDENLETQSFVMSNVIADGESRIDIKMTPVRNVVAELPGVGEFANETIVIGAHYDHVGMGGAGSLAPGTVAIHNGADDNGSGTVALLEVAQSLTKGLADKPHRRIIFMAFTGEEKGLLGSAHYVRNPRFDLEQTVAMLNMDMVGRLNENRLTVYGTGTATEFDSLVERYNETAKFSLEKVTSGFGPSDHASFYEAKIPVFHFFTGLHSDYHRPGDDFEKVNLDGITRIAAYVEDIATEIAQAKTRPTYFEDKSVASVQQQPKPRARFGILMRTEDAGVIVDRVLPDTPADSSGLLAGDRFIRINDESIESTGTIRKLMTELKPGTVVDVVIERNGEEKKISVELGG